MKYPWNQKNLDYEIETKLSTTGSHIRTFAWNQKNLDYEIETKFVNVTKFFGRFSTWNQKNLDYEIETAVVNINHD